MKPRVWMAALLLLAACRKAPPANGGSLLPAALGDFHRTALGELPPAGHAITRHFTAEYDGAGHLQVDLYETKSSGTAFEMTQHWREQADSVFFDRGVYFVVVKWQRADRQALTRFVREMQKRLQPAAAGVN